ncbi:branched-chain amino acid ABC transporter permease [Microbacterium sp. SLBN-111]|uniref:branched-chain amino acid ABC transporter permease n=1 Tax=Microbacterium sp. SLBN-111 TaxID=3377733 RepID=UPI003C738DBB
MALIWAFCAAALAMLLGATLSAGPAFAATTAPVTTQTEVCTPSPTTGCLNGTLAAAGGGVTVTATGPGGTASATTDDSGKWSIGFSEPGDYSVSVDPETLPDGVTLRSTDPSVRTLNLGSQTAVLIGLNGSAGGSGDAAAGTDTASAGGFDWGRLAQQAASGLRLGLLLALAAVGLSLIYGTTGISNFAHGELVTLGGLLAYLFANVLGLNIFVAGIIVVAICAAFGYFQDVGIWRPLRKRRLSLTQLMIVTIGMSLALQYTFQFFIGASTVRIITANPVPVRLGPVSLSVDSLVSMGISVVVLIGVGLFLLKTRVGRATRAVSDNPALAAASGINVDGVVRLIWTTAAALAGLSGILLGLVLNGVNWMTGMQLLLLLFSAVTLGGLGTAFGALFGALIIGMTVELTNIWLPGDFKYATALVLLILLLLVRPQGLFGRKERVG